MKTIFALAFAFLLSSVSAFAQDPAATATLSGTTCPGSGCLTLSNLSSRGAASILVSGTFSGALFAQVSNTTDAALLRTVSTYNAQTGQENPSITAPGLYLVPLVGMTTLRVLASLESGTAVVRVVAGAAGGMTPPTGVQNVTGNVTVDSSALPTGAATEATLSSLNGKVTAVNTGAVVVSSSALPSGAATSAAQTTGNASLTSIDGKTPALGQATMANSTPVAIASNQSALPISGTVTANAGTGTMAVSAASLPLPSGASTSAAQTTGNASLATIEARTPALVSGRQPVDGSGVTQPVSAAALPLPAGAATAARQDTGNATLDLIQRGVGDVGANVLDRVVVMGAMSLTDVGLSYLATKDSDPTAAQRGLIVRNIPSGTQAVSAASLPLPAGAATSAAQGTSQTSLDAIAQSTSDTFSTVDSMLSRDIGNSTTGSLSGTACPGVGCIDMQLTGKSIVSVGLRGTGIAGSWSGTVFVRTSTDGVNFSTVAVQDDSGDVSSAGTIGSGAGRNMSIAPNGAAFIRVEAASLTAGGPISVSITEASGHMNDGISQGRLGTMATVLQSVQGYVAEETPSGLLQIGGENVADPGFSINAHFTNTTPTAALPGMVVRNIPSGTQEVSGTVAVSNTAATTSAVAVRCVNTAGNAFESCAGGSGTTGQQVMALSAPVVIASNQSAVPVTSNLNTIKSTLIDSANGSTSAGTLRVTMSNDSTGVLASVGSITGSVTPGTGATNLGKAEDTAHATGDVGVGIIAPRVDGNTITESTDANGDHSAFAVDAFGAQWNRPGHPAWFTCTMTSTAVTSTILTGCLGQGGATAVSPGAGLRRYITNVTYSSSIISTTTNFFTLQYGTGTTCGTGTAAIYRATNSVAFLQVSETFIVPLATAAAVNLCFIHPGAGTRLITVTGFIAR